MRRLVASRCAEEEGRTHDPEGRSPPGSAAVEDDRGLMPICRVVG